MRKGELILNFLSLLGIPLMLAGVFAGKIVRFAPIASKYAIVIFGLLGFILFVLAKISVIRRGELFTYGVKAMDSRNKYFYIGGYVLMITAFVLMLGMAYQGRL